MIVRKLRLQQGWSQDQLATLSGLSVRTIQRLERGGSASLESAKALASVFEVDVSTFLPEDSDMTHTELEPKTPTPQAADHPAAPTPTLKDEEREAIRYAKRVKEFYEGLTAFVILALVFSIAALDGWFFGDTDIVLWVFLGVGAGLVVQGLIAFEVIRIGWTDWEKKLVEKRLGRKL